MIKSIFEAHNILIYLLPVIILAVEFLIAYWITIWYEIPLHNLKNQTLQMTISLHSVWKKQYNTFVLYDTVRNVEVARLIKNKNNYLLEMENYQVHFNETILQHILDKNYLPVVPQELIKPKRKILQRYKPGEK